MAFSMASITSLFKRSKKAQDPFGSDDDEDFIDEDFSDDEDSEGRGLGPKIAIGVSAGLSLLIVVFIATVILTADETAGPVAGAMPTEITQFIDENGRVLQDLTAMPDEGTAALKNRRPPPDRSHFLRLGIHLRQSLTTRQLTQTGLPTAVLGWRAAKQRHRPLAALQA